MGNTAAKAREAHAQAKSKPKTGRNVQQQKLKSARATGVLALPDSKLKKLPEELLELSALRTLDLTANRLSELPPQLNALKALKTLKVASNVLVALPDLSGLDALTTCAEPRAIAGAGLVGQRGGDSALEFGRDAGAAGAQCGRQQADGAAGCSGEMYQAQGAPIAAELLGEGSAVQVMNLEGNPMTKEDLQGMDGFDAFLTRRTKLKNKEIHGGLNSDLSLCGLE
ncbi:hypothetical protein ON010_g10641 [Phytophthora cinnamomi]|nr:hypothetical protein ON010_g10641 [Phytophthora cinnamomi]